MKILAPLSGMRLPSRRGLKRFVKKAAPAALLIYLIPYVMAGYFVCGLLDFLRNTQRTLPTFERYFVGNGFFTWLLSPFNLLLDLLCLPYRNRGVYQFADLPKAYQAEIATMIEAAHRGDLVNKLQAKLGDAKRGMIFFKWYGKNVDTTVEMPAFHQNFKYIRTIGVSIFNTKSSTAKHFGPLRITLRLLYNINDITSRDVYIQVGKHANHWCDNKLFIFDDTLEHQSCNQSDEVRYCLFVDILRPSIMPGVLRGILGCVRFGMARCNAIFYKHWTFMK